MLFSSQNCVKMVKYWNPSQLRIFMHFSCCPCAICIITITLDLGSIIIFDVLFLWWDTHSITPYHKHFYVLYNFDIAARYCTENYKLLNGRCMQFTSGWLLLGNRSETVAISIYAVSIHKNALASNDEILLSSSSSLFGFLSSSFGGCWCCWGDDAVECIPLVHRQFASCCVDLRPERCSRLHTAWYSRLMCL